MFSCMYKCALDNTHTHTLCSGLRFKIISLNQQTNQLFSIDHLQLIVLTLLAPLSAMDIKMSYLR